MLAQFIFEESVLIYCVQKKTACIVVVAKLTGIFFVQLNFEENFYAYIFS